MRAGYLRRTSLLYRPPYLLRCAASSVISGIQLANTAYVHSKHASQYPLFAPARARATPRPPRRAPYRAPTHKAVCSGTDRVSSVCVLLWLWCGCEGPGAVPS